MMEVSNNVSITQKIFKKSNFIKGLAIIQLVAFFLKTMPVISNSYFLSAVQWIGGLSHLDSLVLVVASLMVLFVKKERSYKIAASVLAGLLLLHLIFFLLIILIFGRLNW